MTRRTFLKSLGVAGAGVAAGLSMLPTKAKPRTNPLWVNAKYEPLVVWAASDLDEETMQRIQDYYNGYRFRVDPNPMRFELIDGEWRRAEWA